MTRQRPRAFQSRQKSNVASQYRHECELGAATLLYNISIWKARLGQTVEEHDDPRRATITSYREKSYVHAQRHITYLIALLSFTTTIPSLISVKWTKQSAQNDVKYRSHLITSLARLKVRTTNYTQ